MMGFSSLAEARVYCYDRYTGEFLHWGACYQYYSYAYYRTPGRTYCYDRYTGNFLHWGHVKKPGGGSAACAAYCG